jgi:hypothetical protein
VYHLMLNTAVGEDAVVDTILRSANLVQPEPVLVG